MADYVASPLKILLCRLSSRKATAIPGKITLQPRVAVVSLLVLLSYLLLPLALAAGPGKNLYKLPLLNPIAVKKSLYTRDVKDTDNAEVETKIVTD